MRRAGKVVAGPAGGDRWWRRGLAAAGRLGPLGVLATLSVLSALALPVAAHAGDFDLPSDLGDHAVLSCQELTLSGGATVSADGIRTGSAEAEEGHVRSNGDITLDGGVEVHGDATAGPGGQIFRHGKPSLVTGTESVSTEPFDCAPVDLDALRAALEASNDDGALPQTAKGKDPLGGKDGRSLVLNGHDSLTIPSGTYLLGDLRLAGGATLVLDGRVEILVTGTIDIQGGAQVNADGGAYDLRLWSAGNSVAIDSQAVVRGFLYAPAAAVHLGGKSLLAGAVQGDQVEIAGGAQVVRVVDDVPPELTVDTPGAGDLVETCLIPVAGHAEDGEGPVTLTVNGDPITVEDDGSFTGTADLATDDPGLVVFEATDQAGNTTRVEVRVEIVPPAVALVDPPPGSLVGQRVVDLAGTSGTATEVTVNGVAAQVPGDGTFALPGFDLGEDGLVTLTFEASNCGGSVQATAVLDLDTLPPTVVIDSPSPGTLFGSQPVTVSGTVEDAHLDMVTVNGVAATIDGGRFTAQGVPLTEGDNTLTATATDALGRSTDSAPVTVTLDTTAPTVTITAPAAGTVLDTPTITVSGEVSDPHLDTVRVGDVVATVSGMTFEAAGVTLTEGDNFLVAEATDLAGNSANSPSVVVVLDTLPPVVTLDTDGLPELTGETAIPVTGTAVDPHLDSVTANGVTAAVTGDQFAADSVPLEEGANEIVAEAVDTLGHHGQSAPATVTRDTLPPEVAITEPAAGAELTERTVTVRGTVSDPHLDRVSVGGVEATVTDGTFVAEGVELPEGDSEIVAHAVDVLDHAADSEPVPVVVDTLPPVVRLDSPADSLVATSPVTVTGHVDEPHLDSVTVAGVEAVVDGDGGFTAEGVELAEGENQITATARDTFGHEATSDPVVYVLDTLPPTIAITAPLDGAIVFDRQVEVVGTASDPHLDGVTVNGVAATLSGDAGDGTFTATVPVVDGANLLTAVATDRAGHTASTAVSVLLDTLPPGVTVDTPASGACLAAGQLYSLGGAYADPNPATGLDGQPPPVRVTVQQSDGGIATYAGVLSADGTRWSADGVDLGGVDGTATASIVAVDVLGNASQTASSWRVDATVPTLALTLDGGPFPGSGAGAAPPSGAVAVPVNRAVAAGVQVEDGASAAAPRATVMLDGAPYAPGTAITGEGEHLLVAQVSDCAGHGAAVHAYFRIDRTPPALVSSDPAAGAVVGQAVGTFQGVASEPLAAATVAGEPASLSGTSFQRTPFPWTEGTNEVTVELVDLAGNRSSQTVTFTVHTVPLSVEILESGAPLADGATFLRPVRPEIRASDSRATVTATLDGAPFVSGTAVNTSGDHHLVATARDDAGGTAGADVHFHVDLGPGPEVAITTPQDGDTLTGPTTVVEGTVSGDQVTVTVNGTPAVVSGGTWRAEDVPLEADVPNAIEAVARDRAGRTATDGVVVQVTAAGPQVLILDPPDGAVTGLDRIDVSGVVVGGRRGSADGTVTVTNVGTGDSQTVSLATDGSFRATDVPLATGANTLQASTRDPADRVGTAEVGVTADFQPPAVGLSVDGTALADGAAFGRPITLAVTVSDDAGTPPAPVVRLNGEVLPDAASPETDVPITDEGGYVVAVVARDDAGNETRTERSFTVDFGGCSLADVHPAAGTAVSGASVTLAGRSGAAAAVTVRVPSAGGGFQDYPAAVADGTFLAGDVPLPVVGENALVLVCTDAAGGEQTQNHPIERLADGDGPTVTIEQPADGAVLAADALAVEGTVSGGSVTVNGVAATITAATGADAFRADGVSLVEGPNVLGARALDGAGRVGTDRVVVDRDTQAPQVQITRPDNKSRIGRPGTGAAAVDVGGLVDLDTEPHLARVTVASSAGTVTASVDAATGAFLASAVPLDPAAGGASLQTLTVTATDDLGHSGTSTVGVYYDGGGPAIVLDAPEDLVYYGVGAPDQIAVSGDAWAADGARISINGIDLDPATLAWSAPAADGRRHARFTTSIAMPTADGAFGVIARVTDLDDASAQDRRQLFRDTVAPEVAELVPADGTSGVDPNSLMLVLFSEPVLHSSLAAADGLTLAHAGGGTVVGRRTVAGQAVALAPGAALEEGGSYVFRAGTGITDRAGNPLAAPAEAAFTVAVSSTAAAPSIDPLPAVVCADEVTVTGSATPGATIEVLDGDLTFRGFADTGGRFSVPVPATGSGYHLLRIRSIDGASGATSPETTAVLRIDCSAPRVTDARFDRSQAVIEIDLSEPVDPATVAVGGASDALRVTDAEAPDVFYAPALSFPSPTTIALALDTAPDAWWRDRPVRLQVGPPAADLEGNVMDTPFETVFFPGSSSGLAGGFLFGEAYDDLTGRPLAGASARLFVAGTALPGTVPAGSEGTPVASATTDGRGRYVFAGEVPSGRYVLAVGADGYTTVYRRLSLAPTTGVVPFDSRPTPRADAAGTIDPSAGGTIDAGVLHLAADPGALGGTDPITFQLTPLTGQGLPDFLPLGWTPAGVAEVRATAAGLVLPEGPADWLPGGVTLTLPLPAWVAADDPVVAVRHAPNGGGWTALVPAERLTDGTARLSLTGPGVVALVVPDRDPATAPLVVPSVEGESLVGVDPPASAPALTADLTLDPPVVPPTGRSRARVVARSADGVTPWPSGLAVQAYLEEKLILAGGGGQVLEAPFSVDLVLYHSGLSDTERAGAVPGAAGAMELSVSPSPRAAQVLLDVGYENLRVYPFPEEVEREPLVGPTGGTVETPEGVELVVPEGALSVKVPVSATLLDADALAALPAVAGYDTVAAVRVDLSGKILGRPATLSLPAPAALSPETAGDPRLLLAERVDAAADGRGAYPKLTARARLDGAGADARVVASPNLADLAGALPLEGLVRGGLYLVLQARAPIGFATGFVYAENGSVLAGSRVVADGLGTADVTPAGGRYSIPVPSTAGGTGASIQALHPTLDERGSAPVPAVDPGQVTTLDLTIHAVAPTVVSVAPVAGAVDQPVGTTVSILFSEPLSSSTVTASTLTLELAGADGGSGLFVDGTVSLSADGTRVVFTPERPLLPGRTFRARFDGGVADAGGTFYQGAPTAWTFATSTAVVSGGQVHPERFHIQVPVNGVAAIYGDPGAVPSVPAGSTPWVVTPEVAGDAADPVVDTYPVSGDGSFSGTAGHPPDFAIDLGSEVWVKVFDPSGALAAEIRLGPFVTPDGKGFVAPAGEAVSFRSVDGVEVQVPAAAFDAPTLVTVTMRDPATLGMDVPRGLAVGAYVSLDFDGEANESLRLAVPAPADAPAGAQVFVGEPVSLPWGRRFKFLTLGAVEQRSDGKVLSNDPSLWPDAVGTVSGGSLAPQSATTGAAAGGATLTPKKIPTRFLKERMQEFVYRNDAVWFYEFGASWGVMGGSVAPFSLGLGIGLEAIYNKIADLMVYVPSPRDWNGGFVLPVLTDEPLEIVRRDTATGWVLSETPYDPLPSGGGVVDVGTVPGAPAARPLLADSSPFRLIRFQPPGPGGTLSLGLELQVRESSNGTVVVSSVSGFPLEKGSSVALYDLTPALPADPEAEPTAPIAGPSTTVCDPSAPWELDAMPAGEEMMVVVGPGGLDAGVAGSIDLQLDRPLVDLSSKPVDQVARLLDLGPLDDCAASGVSGYPRTLPLALEQSARNSRLDLTATVSLPSGHRFRLEVEPGSLVAEGDTPLAYWPSAPHQFDFATAEIPGEPVAGTPEGQPALGSTTRARDLVKLGNLLVIASEDGPLVTVDTSDTSDAGGFKLHSILNRSTSYARALATDGHNRVFYSGLLGPFWVTRVLRREDAREASAECVGSPDWAAGLPCFNRVNGNVRVAYQSGYNSGLTPSEWLATGTLPSGTPTALSILTQDEKGRALPLGDFVGAYVPGADDLAGLTPDAEGVYTLDVALQSTLVRSRAGTVEPSQPPGTEPPAPVDAWRNRGCEGEESYDRYQRVTVDNLTTGQSWSLDIENPWPDGSGDGSAVLHGVRARRGDRLRVRYNLRAIGHLAIIGSGITVLDLNRLYRLGQTVQPLDDSQCGRRLGTYEGQEIDYPSCAPSSAALYSGLSWVPEVEALSATGCDGAPCRGEGRIDVYAPVIFLGAVHATSKVTEPGAIAPQAELAACIDKVGDQWAFVDDVTTATDVTWLDRGIHGRIDGTFDPPADGTTPHQVTGDLMALALGDPGVFVFDISERSILSSSRGPSLIGHLHVDGHSVYRVQVDPVRKLLFAGGTDLESGKPVIDVWDLASVNGAPELADRPVPQATLHAAWGAKQIGIDGSGTGLLYTWSDQEGAQAVPFDAPDFQFAGLYRPENEDSTGPIEAVERPTARFVPLGVPLKAAAPAPEEKVQAEQQDERDATAAFKLRVALPGSLGPELTAKVQSLRIVPPQRFLGSDNAGASVTPPGGPGWPDNEVIVRLRRLGVGPEEPGGAALAGGESGPLGVGYQLYESVETVLLEADPRAGRDYRRQDAAGTEADEEGQCRNCDWPAYLPDPSSTAPALDDVKELLAGAHVRAFLFASDEAGAATAAATRAAIAWFAQNGANYPAPTGLAAVAAAAAPVPAPLQVALAEPPRNPAMWDAGEAGVTVGLTGGDLMLASADHAVRGRSIPFVFERDYRSGTLGYGPLGAAGWWSPLFAHVRELPSGEVVYFDGRGHAWRFPPATDGDPPAGYDEEEGASYDTPTGLFVRLQKLSGGLGWVLVSPQHGTARFDGDGRLIEVGDRHYKGGTAGDPAGSQGSHLRLRYDPFGQLALVVDDLGRSYRFDYYEDPRPVADGGDGPRYGLLRSITDFVDRTVEYRWDDQRRLTEVRLPEVENPVDAYAEFSYTGGSRPTLRYRYDPSAGVSAQDGATGALLHGEFAKLRLASCILPTFVDGAADVPRERFEYDQTTGRVKTVAFPTPGNANSGGDSVAWQLEVPGGGGTVGPVDQVDVTAPWGHVVHHLLSDGRLVHRRETLEVVHAGQAPTEDTVETSFEYADDGRLLTTTRPDGARISRCYADGKGGADCQAAGQGGGGTGGSGDTPDRLARSDVVARVQAATTQESQGSADYTQIVAAASYQSDNLVKTVTDGENRTIDLSVPEASEEVRALFRTENVGARTVYDAYGRPKSSTGEGTAAPQMSVQYGEDAQGVAGAGLVSRIEQGSGDQMASWQTLSYDAAYNVDETRSSYGELRKMTYDAWDRPVRTEQGLSDGGPLAPLGSGSCGSQQGAAMERAYDAAGHVIRERRLQDLVDPATGTTQCRWQETRYHWNLREQLVGVEQSHLADPTTPGAITIAPQTVQERSYDEDGRLASVRQAALTHPSVVTSYRYDAAGRIAGVRSGAEGERLLGYDTMSRVVLRTDGDQGTWRGRYDAWDRLYHEEMPTGAVRRTRYNRANQPIEAQTFSADPLSDPAAELLSRTRYELTSFGAVRRVIEDLTDSGERRVTETDFDGSGRPVAVWRGPEGDPGVLDRDRARREVETVYEPSSGRVLARRFGGAYGAPPLHEQRFEYSAEAAVPWPVRQVSFESVPGQADLVETFTTTLERDVLGRVLSQTRSDGEERFTLYDRSSNNALRVRTGAGTEMSYSRDGRGLPVKVTRPNGRGYTVTSYDLDGVPLVERTATADGTALWETDSTYDSTGRVVAMDYADGTREERTYRADSQVATVKTRDGLTLTMAYDAANRLTAVTPSAAGATTTLLDAGDSYAYDSLSRPTRIERGSVGLAGMDPALTLAYPSYDLASRPSAEVVGERDPLAWTYDTFDRPVQVELPAGSGRASGGSLLGFQRVYDTLDRLETATGLGAAGLSATPLGATWSWGGASRLYAMDTLGALGTGVRYGYHGGAGPQVPGIDPGTASDWKLGRLSWGGGGGAATAPLATTWGDFGYGWRGHEGEPSDGVKIGRQVLGAGARTDAGVLSGLGWSWDYDAGVRLQSAISGEGDLAGRALPAEQQADRFTFQYGAGDELLGQIREATGVTTEFTTGDYGRIATRDGVAFTYDGVGRRLEDDRFVYQWDWRGQLVEVDVKPTWPDEDGDGAPDVSPYAGDRVRYEYDARGRLTRRLHEGADAGNGSRPFIEERAYVWEEDRLAAESAYGAPTTAGTRGPLRWRRTYVPGPSGLDDPAQVVVEIAQPGSPFTGEARTYTYLRDELGTVIGLVAEDEGSDPANPPVPVRYRYTPYGEAHAETGPELLRARFANDATDVATSDGLVTQTVADDTITAAGALDITWSLPLDPESLTTGLAVEQLLPGSGWTPVDPSELELGQRPTQGLGTGGDPATLRILLTSGWTRGTGYRIRLTPELQDRLQRRFGQSQTLDWTIPAAPDGQPLPPVQYDQRFAPTYDSAQAAADPIAGRFPAGQNRLFQGLWTDPVTGMAYARARWYDARNAHWLSEDPLGAVDSTNLYAFVGWQPNMGVDPLGLYDWDQFKRDAVFWADVALFTNANLNDPRNAWKNTQRAAGGLVGSAKMVGKAAVGTAVLVLDNSGPVPTPGAMVRNVERAEAVADFVEHPVDTVVDAHKRVIAEVEEHEARGEYFSSGMASGEMASGDAAVVIGAAEGGAAVFRLARSGGLLGAVESGATSSSRVPGINLVSVRSAEVTAGAQEAALLRAAAVQQADIAQAAGRTTGVASALRVGDRVFTDVSTGGAPRTLHPAVEAALDRVPNSLRPRFHTMCAEPGCLSQAFEAGLDPRGGASAAVRIRGVGKAAHGTLRTACPSCATILDELGIRYW